MRAPSAARASAWLRRLDLRRMAVDDFPLKAAAVLIALVLWAGAIEAGTRETTVDFGGRVPVQRPEVPAGFVLRATLGEVAVKLRGPEGAVSKVAVDDLRATIDLGGLDLTRPGPFDVPVRVAASDQRVKVIEVSPPAVSVRLERVTARTVAVQASFANEPPKGYAPGTVRIDPPSVRVSGAESAVAAVAAVLAPVRFGDAPVDIAQSAQAMAVDASGKAVDGAETDPQMVQVTVPVLSTTTTRALPVVATLRGQPPSGVWISRVDVDPLAVTVRGDQQTIAALDRIETVAIDVSQVAATRTIAAPLVLQAGVSLLQPVDARVTLTMSPVTGTRPFSLIVQVSGLSPGLVATSDPPTAEVVVTGPVNVLDTLGPAQVFALVDAGGRDPGSYTLDVALRLPPGLSGTVQPARVTLTIRPK